MNKSKKVISALLAASISLTGLGATFKENKFKVVKNNEATWQLGDSNPYIISLLEKRKNEIYYNYITSQIAILEYYHQLENPEFPTYALSEEEITQLARLCQQEQYSLEGVAAEASLMANRFELCNSGYSSLTDYVRHSGWFANANYFMDYGNARGEAIEMVRKVLVNGKRTLPRYVTEHDSLSDVTAINTGETTDKNDYIPEETCITNVYGANYVFYGYEGSSDPFGYKEYNLLHKH